MTVSDPEAQIISSDVNEDDEKSQVNTTDSTTTDSKIVETEKLDAEPTVEKARRQVPISIRAFVYGAIACALVATVGVLAWLYIGALGKLDAQARETSNKERAEEIALDYAVRGAKMDYRDLNPWKADLVKGTSPELKDKLTKAAAEMEQIFTPLQWNSTAQPLVAKTRSDTGGVYIVDAFVSVLTKTVQAPEGLQSTATYSLTIDSNKDWQISDVGGIAAALGSK